MIPLAPPDGLPLPSKGLVVPVLFVKHVLDLGFDHHGCKVSADRLQGSSQSTRLGQVDYFLVIRATVCYQESLLRQNADSKIIIIYICSNRRRKLGHRHSGLSALVADNHHVFIRGPLLVLLV